MRLNRNMIFGAGLGAIIATIALYLFFTDRPEMMDMCGIAFILLAEAAATAGFMVLPEQENVDRSLVVGSGGSVLVLYVVLAVAVSLIFMNFMRGWLTALIIIQFAVAAVAGLLMLGIISAGKNAVKSHRESPQLKSRETLQKMAGRVQVLMENSQYTQFKGLLRSVHEELTYSDYGEAAECDGQIASQLDELEKLLPEGSQESVEALLGKLLSSISQRKVHVAASKRGIV